MLLEHQAAMKLARKLAKKIGAEPEKFGELARKAAQAPEGLACGLNYGPIPIGAAGKALNFMHWAVNGVRPYPEEGEGPLKSKRGCSEYRCPIYGCALAGSYNIDNCVPNDFRGLYDDFLPCPGGELYGCVEESFDCDEETANNMFICNSTHHDCHVKFTCPAVYKHKGGGECPFPEKGAYNCPMSYMCESSGGSRYDCPSVPGQSEPRFGCQGEYSCWNLNGHHCASGDSSQGYDCSRHNCGGTGAFECSDEGGFDCTSSFHCSASDAVSCNPPETFDCSGDVSCNSNGGYDYEK